MDVQDYLERNTFTCARLHARITPEQCAINQQEADLACAGCLQAGGAVVKHPEGGGKYEFVG